MSIFRSLCCFSLSLCQRLVRLFVEVFLGVDKRFLCRLSGVCAVRLLYTCFDIVRHHHIEHLQNAVLDAVVIDGRSDFHTPSGVSGHPVRRGNVYLAVVVRTEDVDACMLQKTSHNAADRDILRQLRNAGNQAADATDDHVDHVRQLVLQALWRNQQMLRVFHGLSQAERMKDPVCLQTDVMVCRHQRIVGVDGRGLFVVVACADLGDIGDLCADLFGDETELAVYFQIVQTVDNAAAGIFQAAGPFDVVLLVESGTEFHQYHNILAVFSSVRNGRMLS